MMRSTALAVLATIGIVALSACSNPPVNAGTAAGPPGGEAAGEKIVAQVAKNQQLAATLPAEVAGRGTLAAAINPDVAPVKFTDTDGKIVGLNPDLLRAAGKVLGITVTFQQTSFDAQVPGLQAKRFDLIASAGDFVERQTAIDFIDYLQAGTAILTKKGFKSDALTPQDLCGITVGYPRGAAQQGLLTAAERTCESAGKPPIGVNGYGDANSGLLAVQSGQADAFWGDLAPMVFNATTKPDQFKVVYQQSDLNYGIGVSKSNPQLRDALHAALKELVDDGVYAQLLKAWGQQDFGRPELPMNNPVHLTN
ncbi:ABC transporter substrate-binding protein [Amycolatopsis pigmentata]|uniref:ABC transporter substrate-binding protein n=1 Tax=Amycolatopsis pigmentata TaxID=450801 RepID=A0ABW5G1G9_9PSEU